MRNILVTGASGLVGYSVCDVLQQHGFSVYATYHAPFTRNENWHQLHSINLETDDLSDMLNQFEIDLVVHVAAQIPRAAMLMEECAERNRIMDNKLLESVQKSVCKPNLLFISSCSVYGAVFTSCIDEQSPLNPANVYAEAKLHSEQRWLSSWPNTTVFRINAPYAAHSMHRNVMKLFIEKAIQHEPITLQGKGERRQDFIHTRDIAHAILCFIQHPNWGTIYNIASGTSISMKELAELIMSLAGGDSNDILFNHVPDLQEHQTAQFNIQKAMHELAWRPQISLEEGLSTWIEHLKHSLL